MSVYTTVTAEELDAWLARYAVGGVVEHQPIASGQGREPAEVPHPTAQQVIMG